MARLTMTENMHSITFFDRSFCGTFMKGCKWSPDGLCLLTAADDNKLRLFEVSENFSSGSDPCFSYNDGGMVYDYAWYPSMSSDDPTSCVFASCSKDAPVHLWDACNGTLRATYQPINQYDEVHNAYSVCFSQDGKLYCGYRKEIKIFDLSLPGRQSDKRVLKDCQPSIISCIAVNPIMSTLYALGSYDKSLGIYTEPKGELLCLFQGHTGGVTQLMFSPDGHRLYSGARKDSKIFCWDLRYPGTLLFTASRAVNTCQRIHFDFAQGGRFLLSGSTDGTVRVFDTNQAIDEAGYLPVFASWIAHNDCTNGVSVNSKNESVATASGQRRIVMEFSDDEDGEFEKETSENCLKIWNINWNSLPFG